MLLQLSVTSVNQFNYSWKQKDQSRHFWALVCCSMIPGLSIMYDHAFLNLKITRWDIWPHIKWAVSLVTTYGQLNLPQGLCGYVWVNILYHPKARTSLGLHIIHQYPILSQHSNITQTCPSNFTWWHFTLHIIKYDGLHREANIEKCSFGCS